ncbi:hypothetical protein A3K63_02395 [Candidatus Micrarchaeota archaeon RBG_16_49_10]|nr:MAG: hypothetical protein A3K63_02395 [Candidatus Micrarchaeota archaeon RBG_16_49_10]
MRKMRKALLTIPLVLGLFLMGTAMAHVLYKPFELNKISASAFDFLPETIETLDDLNPSMMYLHYARADATVTERVITPQLIFYDGSLKFTARGLEVTSNGKYKEFRVNLKSIGLLDCYDFSSNVLECTASDGMMTVTRSIGTKNTRLETVTFYVDKYSDEVTVHAEDSYGSVLDATGDLTTFNYMPYSFPLNPGP